MKTTKENLNAAIESVYRKLQNREIHPSGQFDSGGRFYLDNADLVKVRTPSRAYPYSQMLAGRTKKYVKGVAEKFNCENEEDILRCI